MKLTKGHKQVSCYADGGQVSKPTFAKAVANRVAGDSVSDGYEWFPKAKAKLKSPRPTYTNSARQKALDET